MVVVYKIDRLSRSLMDFAKLVEVFDRNSVTFVSVTQSFNTTTSMGRLTLNVLLSFAQFEREVIGERIRDKFAASRKKGMWMGGWAPLGYDVKDRKLLVNESEAATVRSIFQRFLRVGSMTKLTLSLRSEGMRTKGGKPVDKGYLYRSSTIGFTSARRSTRGSRITANMRRLSSGRCGTARTTLSRTARANAPCAHGRRRRPC